MHGYTVGLVSLVSPASEMTLATHFFAWSLSLSLLIVKGWCDSVAVGTFLQSFQTTFTEIKQTKKLLTWWAGYIETVPTFLKKKGQGLFMESKQPDVHKGQNLWGCANILPLCQFLQAPGPLNTFHHWNHKVHNEHRLPDRQQESCLAVRTQLGIQCPSKCLQVAFVPCMSTYMDSPGWLGGPSHLVSGWPIRQFPSAIVWLAHKMDLRYKLCLNEAASLLLIPLVAQLGKTGF